MIQANVVEVGSFALAFDILCLRFRFRDRSKNDGGYLSDNDSFHCGVCLQKNQKVVRGFRRD